MRHALIQSPPLIALAAMAGPPRDRTSRLEKAMTHCKDEWSRA